MTVRPRICFVVESGTDVRLVEGLAERSRLTVVARRIVGGVEISHPPRVEFEMVVGPASRAGFARFVFTWLRRAERFDFVLVQGYGPAAAAAHLALRDTPSAMLVCSPAEDYYACRKEPRDPLRPYHRYELAAVRMCGRLNARLSGRYVVLSRHLAEVARAHGRVRQLELIPVYGVDTGIFRPSDRAMTELRRRRGLPESGSLIFFSSRIAPEKDTETLLKAFRRLCDDGRDVHLLNRSGGFEQFADAARRHGVAHRVIATPAVHPHDELPLDYVACDVCVQSSRAEGLGYSVLEAMACGVPVIAAKVGGLSETVIDGVTGWTYPPRDSAALHARLCDVLDDSAEGGRRAAAGMAMVRDRYERSRVFDRLFDFISRAVPR